MAGFAARNPQLSISTETRLKLYRSMLECRVLEKRAAKALDDTASRDEHRKAVNIRRATRGSPANGIRDDANG